MPSRDTTTRDRHRAVIRRGKPPCGICGGPIDYSLRYPDPGSFVVDHVVPTSKGGADVLANKQPAHRACNRAKSDRLAPTPSPPPVTTWVTDRTW